MSLSYWVYARPSLRPGFTGVTLIVTALAIPRAPSVGRLLREPEAGEPRVQSTASYVSAGKQGAHRAARREAPRARAVSRRPQAQLHHSYTSRPQGLGAGAVCNQWAGVFGLVAPPASPVCS